MEEGKKTLLRRSLFRAHKSVAEKYNSSLKKFFIYELRNIYWIEKYLAKEFPQVIKAVYADELKYSFEAHLEITQLQIIRLEEIFKNLTLKHKAIRCSAVKVMLKEGKVIIKRTGAHTIISDKGLILAGRKMDHYMIATYGEMVKHAHALGLTKVSQSLYMALEEEMDADTDLREIVENGTYADVK